MGECFLTLKGKAETYFEHAGLNTGVERWLERIGYFDAPASKGHHLARIGGLVNHSINVTRRLVELTETLGVKWLRKESPFLVGMLHDLVKCRCYRAINGEMRRRGEASEGSRERSEAPEGPARGRAQDAEPKWEYVQPLYPGHGACSVMIATELGISLYPDEIAAITYHMGMYGVGREYTDKEFDNALRLHGPQVLATIYADWWAARVDEESEGAV